jgi:hypothetical protein
MDAKDVFHFDPDWNYITNRPKEPVVEVEAKSVHETYEVDTTNSYGAFSKLIQDFKKNMKAELKKAEPDTDTIVNEFTSAVTSLVTENPGAFGGPTSSAPTGFSPAQISPNFSGGPIPGKNYDISDTQSFDGEDEPLEP